MALRVSQVVSKNQSSHNGDFSPYANLVKTALPFDGMSRWKQIEPFSPFSREKFRQLVMAGKAPPPVRLSERCTCYSNRELHRFFSDPLNYRAPDALPAVGKAVGSGGE